MENNNIDVIGFEALYESMYRCKKNVLWKNSVASYYLNGIENTIKLEKQLKDGTYRPRPPKKILITHPKKREAVSIAFRDRVYQRSLNDNVICPVMTKSFVYGNVACQKGKGTDLARDTLDKYLKAFFREYGLNGYVLQGDIKGYYPNMSHRIAEKAFQARLPEDVYRRAEKILRDQYSGDKGYNPGSQMIQIAGISVLDRMDHLIKEELHIKYYLRYMDDFILIHQDKDYLEYCKDRISEHLSEIEFELHPKKTGIYPIDKGLKFLGFTHRPTKTGKIIRTVDSKNVKAERKKLFRMVQLVKAGRMEKKKVDICFCGWLAHIEKSNSHQLTRRMQTYYKNLWR